MLRPAIMAMLPLLLLIIVGAAVASDPQALLFESCALSADGGTTLNGYVCGTDTATLVIGCLSTHRAYACALGSGTWIVLS